NSYPSVSIIIPARNEEKSLPLLLASLRDQDFVPAEIITVVSQSEDRTWEIAEQAGVRTIESEPVPEGWVGKSWACYQGAIVAKGEILIFLDSDTFLEEDGLEKIVTTCMENDGVISIQPYHRTKRVYEQLSAFFNIVMMGAMGPFTVMANRIKPIGFFGPCIAVRNKYYFESGGHGEVRGAVVEDLALGETFKIQRIPIHCYGGKGTISFRMYPNGMRELVDGWSKGFATGAAKTYIPILLAIVAWIGGGIAATRYFIEALLNVNTLYILMWASVYLGYVAQIYWMLYRIGTFKFYTAVFYPVSLIFFLIIFLRSFFVIFIRRSVRWKGVTISVKKDKAPAK
ncbi:MAG: glycosyltransferase family 2 protein, partial [Dehalococcoidia bacterium]|nr:glycosyltransferase family 2 protein [Dehalococcoidia bacterium]